MVSPHQHGVCCADGIFPLPLMTLIVGCDRRVEVFGFENELEREEDVSKGSDRPAALHITFSARWRVEHRTMPPPPQMLPISAQRLFDMYRFVTFA